MLVAGWVVSCRTAKPLAPTDLSAPGWRVEQGQVVWQPPGHRAQLAGDLLFATNAAGDFFVQLTKNPFPLVTAQSLAGQWQIEFGANEHAWHGRGAPPERFGWFQLPPALLANKTTGNWRFKHLDTNTWRLENLSSGESLEGGFFP